MNENMQDPAFWRARGVLFDRRTGERLEGTFQTLLTASERSSAIVRKLHESFRTNTPLIGTNVADGVIEYTYESEADRLSGFASLTARYGNDVVGRVGQTVSTHQLLLEDQITPRHDEFEQGIQRRVLPRPLQVTPNPQKDGAGVPKPPKLGTTSGSSVLQPESLPITSLRASSLPTGGAESRPSSSSEGHSLSSKRPATPPFDASSKHPTINSRVMKPKGLKFICKNGHNAVITGENDGSLCTKCYRRQLRIRDMEERTKPNADVVTLAGTDIGSKSN